MFDRTIESDRSRAPDNRAGDGRLPEHDREREDEPRSFRGRLGRALQDVGIYGCVSFRDLAEIHFAGDLDDARRTVNEWIQEGLVSESRAEEWRGPPIELLTITGSGAVAVHDLVIRQGLDPGQRFGPTRIPRGQAAHDAAVYRACGHERRRLRRRGAAVRRIRLEGELRSRVSRRSESARWQGGRRFADAERHRAARELGLPIDALGRVLYPDAQMEYTGSGGVGGRINIEVASNHYAAPSIRAKAAAGFVLYAAGAAKARVLRALGQGGGQDSARGAAGRGTAVFEL